MYCVAEEPDEVQALRVKSQEKLESLLAAIPSGEQVLCMASKDLYTDPLMHGFLYRIVEGNINWCRNNDIVFVLEPGDLFGIEHAWKMDLGTYEAPFAVRCERYYLNDFRVAVETNRENAAVWIDYLVSALGSRTHHLFTALQGERKIEPDIKIYEEGEVIVKQGTAGDSVLTLLNGHARVVVDGIDVGEVLADEIFGALAALTDLARTASVIATRRCTVLSLPKERFLELVHARPATVLKMVQDMARTIVDLNKRVVSLSAEKPNLYR